MTARSACLSNRFRIKISLRVRVRDVFLRDHLSNGVLRMGVLCPCSGVSPVRRCGAGGEEEYGRGWCVECGFCLVPCHCSCLCCCSSASCRVLVGLLLVGSALDVCWFVFVVRCLGLDSFVCLSLFWIVFHFRARWDGLPCRWCFPKSFFVGVL